MLVADTNVLLRLVLDDDPVQTRRARERCAKAQRDDETILLPQVVLVELFWVLERVKKIPRLEVWKAVDALLTLPLWEIEQPQRVARAIRYYEDHSVDFVDALLAAVSREKGMEGVLSFDADMEKLGIPWVKP